MTVSLLYIIVSPFRVHLKAVRDVKKKKGGEVEKKKKKRTAAFFLRYHK